MTDLVPVLESISSALYVVLGIWVLTLTPRRRQTTLLGLFAILFGLVWAPVNVLQLAGVVERFDLWWDAIQLLFGVPAFVAAFGLVWAVPHPLEDRRLATVALGLGGGFALVTTGSLLAVSSAGGADLAIFAGKILSTGIVYAAVLLTALRAHPSRAEDPAEVTQLALFSVALAMFFGFFTGIDLLGLARGLASSQPLAVPLYAAPVLAWLLVAGLWGWNMARASDDTVRIHRAAMLGVLGLVTAGTLYFAAFPGADQNRTVMRPVVQTVGVGLLAYGVLRYNLAELDAKVEWTVSKTTVAGVFVAVFFVVSEGAQVLFAGVVGSQLLGILAAGALLFVLSPIQRAADRIAEEVVPSGGASDVSEAERRYRDVVEAALADGEITDADERHLAEKAEELGLSPKRVYEIRSDVEDGTDGGDPS